MEKRGFDTFLELLSSEGVEYLFGNPGTTELAIMEAVGKQQSIEYILGLQEAVVVAMADGYSRASGKLSVANVHVAPGLGNAMGSIFNAKFYGSPVLITAGQQEQGHGLMEPMLYDPLVPIAQPLVKWAIECTQLADLPRIIRRAVKVALTPPTGPVFLSLPGDVLDDTLSSDIGSPTRIDTRVRPSEVVLEELANKILSATNPVIVAGHELSTRNAIEEAMAFSEAIGAGVFQQTVAYSAQYRSEHRAFRGALPRNQKVCHDLLAPHDLIIFLGADVLRMSVYSATDPLPSSARVIQIGERDWELGKNYPAELAIRADIKETLLSLNKLLAQKMSSTQKAVAAERLAEVEKTNWVTKREKLIVETEKLGDVTPILSAKLAMDIAAAIPTDAVVVEEALSSSFKLLDYVPLRDHQSYYGLASGGIGFATAGAIGISLALPNRPIVALIGDGSSMYSIQALWTAAHLKRPITYIIANNRGYKILKQRLRSFRKAENYVGMEIDDPAIDFVRMGESMGLTSTRVQDPKDLKDAIERGIKSNAPNLIEVEISADLDT